MPELPEVEILVRHLAPILKGKTISAIEVRRPRVISPTSDSEMRRALSGATFASVSRRGKYLLFEMQSPGRSESFVLMGHLGMTGRMYLLRKRDPLPRHTAVMMDLGREQFIYEDTRYFGRLTLDTSSVDQLGPEPLGDKFTTEYLATALKRSQQAIKVKLLDQTLVAGVGNIYASEALHRAGISPRISAARLTEAQVRRLRRAIREVLKTAIRRGSTLPLNFSSTKDGDGLFYYGLGEGGSDFYQERLLVYDRAGQSCGKCGAGIRRLVQAARSTYYCPHCQRG